MFNPSRCGTYALVCSLLAVMLLNLKPTASSAPLPLTSQSQAPQVPSPKHACGECHAAIYKSYSSTPMALTTGSAADHLIAGSFLHQPSGVTYRTFLKDRKAYLGYRREGFPQLAGEQELRYYVGSGAIGRGYIYSIEGYWYQTPINFYSHKKVWDMSPGYESVREMPLNHTVDPTCLYCHASGTQEPTPPTQNQYAGEPFTHNGVTCERCHGNGIGHGKDASEIVNPAKLEPERRDGICMQCHLEGKSSILKPGKTMSMYSPGDRISNFVTYFVSETASEKGLESVSHFEALWQSTCKVASGGKMSCISCHDPHIAPAEKTKAEYYREKCLDCHNQPIFSQQHHPENRECTSCHMQKLVSANVSHSMLTDHRIPRKPLSTSNAHVSSRRLKEFGSNDHSDRAWGLAYAEVAQTGDAFANDEAFRLLKLAAVQNPTDPDVLTNLAFLYQQRHDEAMASELYEKALRRDPARAVAAANLAVIYARHGLIDRAVLLWEGSWRQNPGLSEIGINLSIALCARGERQAALETLGRVLLFNPDQHQAKKRLTDLTTNSNSCQK